MPFVTVYLVVCLYTNKKDEKNTWYDLNVLILYTFFAFVEQIIKVTYFDIAFFNSLLAVEVRSFKDS